MEMLGAGLAPTMTRSRFVWNSRHPAEVGRLKAQGTGIRVIARQSRTPRSSILKALIAKLGNAGQNAFE